MTSDGRAEFDPSEIARVDFPTAFRGYDQDAVRRYLSRLAAAVSRAQELGLLGAVDPEHDDELFNELEAEAEKLRRRVQELETQVDELEESASNKPAAVEAVAGDRALDEAELIKLLGQETARVLETARSAGADLVQRAETDATETRRRAETDATETRRLAETEARARMEEADSILAAARSEAAGILATAEADSAEALAKNRAEIARMGEEARDDATRARAEAATQAEAELAAARERSNQLVTDAEAMREEILGDLVQRRRISREQLVVMNAARDRLAVALASARNELDDVTSVLQRAAPAQDEIDVRDPLPESGAQAPGGGSSAPLELDRAQRAEVAELAALLDRNRAQSAVPGGSPPADAGSNGSDPHHGAVANTGTGSGGAVVGGPGSGSDVNGSGSGTTYGTGYLNGSGGHSSGSHSSGNGHSNGSHPNRSHPNGSHPNGSYPNGSYPNGSYPNGSGVTQAHGETGGPGAGAGPGVSPVALATGPVSGDDLPMEYLTLDLGRPLVFDEQPGPMELDEMIVLNEAPPPVEVASVPPPTAPASSDVVGHYAGLGGGVAGSTLQRTATRGDLPRCTPYGGVLPAAFEGRDIALARATPGFRRRLKRAVNDDQSDVLERLRAGRGRISVDELPLYDDQLDAYIDALRPVLFDVVTSGAELLGCLDIPVQSVESLCLQLARHVVECLRNPAATAIEHGDPHDREAILDPIRAIYRDFRNMTLPELIEDALHEAFSLGLFHAIDPDDQVLWVTDPRLDPDPICEDNSASRAVPKGTNFPSGHPRPLSMPGCRCLLIPTS